MIDKKISVSEQVSNLSIEAQLLFTWMIPHADDLGLLPHSTKTIKAMVVPMWDASLETIGNHLESIESQNLIEVWEWEGTKFWRIKNFLKHQTLKKDRKPNTLASNIENWDKVEELGFQVEDNGNPSKVKLSKEKLSKDKIGEVNIAKSPDFAGETTNTFLNLFKNVNPSYKQLFGNKTQRGAMERLLKEHGAEKVRWCLEVLPQVAGKKYSPLITTPLQLENKLGELLIFVKKESNNKPKVVAI